MTILFVILIIIASFVLGLIVLIQNPKGGGLAGNIAGFSTQFMGVKQTNDVLERGTWIFVSVIMVLCLVSKFFIGDGTAATAPASNIKDATVPNTQGTTQPTGPVSPGPNAVPFDAGR